MNDLFLHDSPDASPIVSSDRVLYTPTTFAKSALLYLQEIGFLQAKQPHTSSRTHLSSYLFFCVNSGSGELEYQGKRHKLTTGDCVFIDCQQPYSHSTDKDLWSLSWIHFSGVTMQDIYQKYQERGGRPAFHPENITAFTELHKSLFTLASSDDYIRDMRINGSLNELLVLLMKAKQMLRFTDKKLEDIGYQCGLGAPHYFSRIFKQIEGITPSEFREKW